jgi:group I intron endonuclease
MESKEINGIIYMYTSPSGKSYIGQTIHEEIRKATHKYAYGDSSVFHRAIKRYGVENFLYTVLHRDVKSIDELNRLEEAEIKLHSSLSPNGYNLQSGGLSKIPCEETRKRISEANKGRPRSEEEKIKIGLANKGKPSPMKGKHLSNETKTKLSLSRIGKLASEETKHKMSEIGKARFSSPEAREAISIRNKGKKRSPETIEKVRAIHLGRKRSEQTRKNISDAVSKHPIICIETGIIYKNTKEAGNAVNRHRSAIGYALCGKSKHCAGYHWAYYERDQNAL